VRRDAALPRPALRGAARRRPAGPAYAAGGGRGRGRGRADVHVPLAGLHPDRHRPGRRPHDLVRRRLPQEGRDPLLDADRRLPPDRRECGPVISPSEVAMRTRFALSLVPCALLWQAAPPAAAAQTPVPLVYTVKFPEPARN